MEKQTKCYSVNLDRSDIETMKSAKESTGRTQTDLLSDAVKSGLRTVSLPGSGKALFLVKVRIDTGKIMELGAKLQSGELDKSMILSTYCLKDDPSVGVNIWMADSRDHFDKLFSPHREYYSEIIEINQVVLPAESMKMILAAK